MNDVVSVPEFRNRKVVELVEAIEAVLDDFDGPGLNNAEVIGVLEMIKINYFLGSQGES